MNTGRSGRRAFTIRHEIETAHTRHGDVGDQQDDLLAAGVVQYCQCSHGREREVQRVKPLAHSRRNCCRNSASTSGSSSTTNTRTVMARVRPRFRAMLRAFDFVAMFPPGRPGPDVPVASPVRMLSPAEAAIQTYPLRDTCGERPLRIDPGRLFRGPPTTRIDRDAVISWPANCRAGVTVWSHPAG